MEMEILDAVLSDRRCWSRFTGPVAGERPHKSKVRTSNSGRVDAIHFTSRRERHFNGKHPQPVQSYYYSFIRHSLRYGYTLITCDNVVSLVLVHGS